MAILTSLHFKAFRNTRCSAMINISHIKELENALQFIFINDGTGNVHKNIVDQKGFGFFNIHLLTVQLSSKIQKFVQNGKSVVLKFLNQEESVA